MINIESLDWTKQDGLIPAVVQDADTLRVLMLGYMSKESLAQTLQCGEAVFYSRSRAQLWRKGATSGNVLKLVSLTADCDNDTLLLLARPAGPTCHLDRASCFPDAPANFLAELAQLIETRATTPLAGSYTQKLFESGIRRIAQKVGEEGVEVALAGVAQDEEALLGEAADLSYHLLVLLRARGLGLRDLLACLEARH